MAEPVRSSLHSKLFGEILVAEWVSDVDGTRFVYEQRVPPARWAARMWRVAAGLVVVVVTALLVVGFVTVVA